jgi:hypothetical protein
MPERCGTAALVGSRPFQVDRVGPWLAPGDPLAVAYLDEAREH